MIRLFWRAPAGVFGQLIKISWEKGSPLGLHTHEYPEIFWIDEGPCRHRINGTEEMLDKGDLVFVRASDRHQFTATPAGRFTMTNLECHPDLIEGMKQRHPAPFAGWFDAGRTYPSKVRLTEPQHQQIQQLSMGLASRLSTALDIEGFCLDLARLLVPPRPVTSHITKCPEWLQEALLKAQFPEVFSRGASGLILAAKKSHEHVSRVCLKYLRKTPTELIEQCRMTYAERELRLTSLSILDIALNCGYSTTAQFHRAFKRHYQRTPLRYRQWVRGSQGIRQEGTFSSFQTDMRAARIR